MPAGRRRGARARPPPVRRRESRARGDGSPRLTCGPAEQGARAG